MKNKTLLSICTVNAGLAKKSQFTATRIAAVFICFLMMYVSASGTVYNVTNTTDGNGTNQLRGALSTADAAGGTHTINVAAGTYNLTLGEIQFGNRAENITITGAGAASTIINMNGTGSNLDRIFLINPPGTNSGVIVSISGITFTNGHLKSDDYGGGAICAGGPTNSLSITSCAFTNNTFDLNVGPNFYGGGAVAFTYGGTLSIDQCTFTNNTTASTSYIKYGGAVYFYVYGNNGLYPNSSLSLTNSTFTNNSVTPNARGGALHIQVDVNGQPSTPITSVNVTENNFITNSAPGASGMGGAISVINARSNATVNINYNRFRGNTSGSGNGSALVMEDNYGNVNAINNWWGCNGGPTGGSACADKAYTNLVAGGTASGNLYPTSPYLQLKTTAGSAGICTGSGTTITTSFTSNSAGTAIDPSNLSAFVGLPVTFSATLGTLSNQQATIQASGTATATYTAGTTASTGTVNAIADNVPVSDATARASITINPAPTVTNPANAVTCAGTAVSFSVTGGGSGTLSYQWYKGTTALTNGATGTGSTLSGVTTSMLTISNPGTADAVSDYNVKVSSTTGCAVTSANASLTVNTLPSISSQPASVTSPTTCTGNPVTFNVTAGGSGTLSYQWYKGTTALANGTTSSGSIISGATTATLTISNTSPADNATDYNVRVSSSTVCTPAQSNNAALTVAAPVIATATTSNTEVVSSTNTVITDASCNLIATVTPSGTAPVGGNVSATVTVQGSVQTAPNGSPYAQRHYDIVPSVSPSSATATLTLYFTQAEFTAYNNAPGSGTLLPVNAADAQNYKANIRIFQYHGTGTAPGNYTGTSVEINPADANIIYNSTYSRWEITFDVNGFSGFYLASAGSLILPLKLISFAGFTDGSNAMLQWKTTDEKNVSYFEIERSTDAIYFTKAGQVSVGNSNYSFTDKPDVKNVYYYRLKIIDRDGKYSYSYTIAINLKKAILSVQALPNPFTDKIMLHINSLQQSKTEIRLTDVSGKTLIRKMVTLQVGANAITLNEVGAINKGNYFLRVTNEKMNEMIKLIKAD